MQGILVYQFLMDVQNKWNEMWDRNTDISEWWGIFMKFLKITCTRKIISMVKSNLENLVLIPFPKILNWARSLPLHNFDWHV